MKIFPGKIFRIQNLESGVQSSPHQRTARPKRTPARILLFLGTISALLGCSNSESWLPQELDVMIGRPTTQALAMIFPYYENSQWQIYINNLGSKMTTKSGRRDFDFRFQIVVSTYPNAFSSPDGNIFITTGLLKLCANNEDEMAAVLAHEISHVELRHGIQLLKRQMGRRALMFAIFGFEQPLAKTAGSLANTLQTLGYGRALEIEADRQAVGLLQKTGYSKEGLIRFLKKIQKIEAQTPAPIPVYLNTHPPTKDRLAALEEKLIDR
ncbi:MAG: M48 family metalloprotease [Elusimicrobia bacterium]|nr:M48 family metalloprotease [Elusimicrobiota bacterium]